MTNQEIKSQTTDLVKVIEDSKNKLLEIRNNCPHEETFEDGGTYCSFCGKLIRYNLET